MSTPTASERIVKLIQRLELSAYQFAKQTGLSQQTISNVVSGKNKPSLDTLQAIVMRYPTTATWLLTGADEPDPESFRSTGVALNSEGVVTSTTNPKAVPVGSKRQADGSFVLPIDAADPGLMRELIASQQEQITDLRGQVTDLRGQLSKVWQLVPAAVGKMLSSLGAASHDTLLAIVGGQAVGVEG